MASLRDPHCGNLVDPEHAVKMDYQGIVFYFCSEDCLRHFRYDRSLP